MGITATWNSFPTIRGNVVRHYWKGIGVFIDAQVTVEENVVEHIATWGMSLWDAGHGRASARFRRNAIFDTGACGVSIIRQLDSPPPGHFVQNLLISTGQDPSYDSGVPYCEQTAIATHLLPESFAIGSNVAYSNREPGGQRGRQDLSARDFQNRVQPILVALDKWSAIKSSDFWKEYGLEPEEPEPEDIDTLRVSPADSLLVQPDSLRAPAPADSAAAVDSAAADTTGN